MWKVVDMNKSSILVTKAVPRLQSSGRGLSVLGRQKNPFFMTAFHILVTKIPKAVVILTLFGASFVPGAFASPFVLENGKVKMELGVSASGAPYVDSVSWVGDETVVFEEDGESYPLKDWLPEDFSVLPSEGVEWMAEEAGQGLCATYTRSFAQGAVVTWRVKMPLPQEALLLFSVSIKNTGETVLPVAWFPVWMGMYRTPTPVASLSGWRALSFAPFTYGLEAGQPICLGSRLHSSDEPGVNPYWSLNSASGPLFFALSWCGGWNARVEAQPKGLGFRCVLPPEETQLRLSPGEEITGPVMHVFASRETEEGVARREWLQARSAWGRGVYGGPGPVYPFTYNNWYTTRFDLDGDFIQRQIDTMEPYDFDAFVVDAGWYGAVGDWTPDKKKFSGGQFEAQMQEVRKRDITVGIWSCPQFVAAEKEALPPEVDQPGMYREFIDGWLLDYAGMDFTQFMLDHVAHLCSAYDMGWWKYDQDFFTAETRHGVMKNVVAFENAMAAVRKENPDLIMENCQSGGRMINEFTVFSTQNQWIRDGGSTGYHHAKNNFKEALGALAFMPPWTVNRWTNNPDRNDPNDDAFTRMYCRSAMAGTWGIVADLAKITSHQREVILQEVAHYRRLSALKSDCHYTILYPQEDSKVAGIVFFDAEGRRAAVLLLRWTPSLYSKVKVPMTGLEETGNYLVENVDRATKKVVSGAVLCKKGLEIILGQGCQSVLLFVEPE